MIQNQERLSIYLIAVINKVHKILPLYEEENTGIEVYVDSLLKGLYELDKVVEMKHTVEYMSFLESLEAIRTEIISEDGQKKFVKREVFKTIGIIKKLIRKLKESE